jgi:hypothetical protein
VFAHTRQIRLPSLATASTRRGTGARTRPLLLAPVSAWFLAAITADKNAAPEDLACPEEQFD